MNKQTEFRNMYIATMSWNYYLLTKCDTICQSPCGDFEQSDNFCLAYQNMISRNVFSFLHSSVSFTCRKTREERYKEEDSEMCCFVWQFFSLVAYIRHLTFYSTHRIDILNKKYICIFWFMFKTIRRNINGHNTTRVFYYKFQLKYKKNERYII